MNYVMYSLQWTTTWYCTVKPYWQAKRGSVFAFIYNIGQFHTHTRMTHVCLCLFTNQICKFWCEDGFKWAIFTLIYTKDFTFSPGVKPVQTSHLKDVWVQLLLAMEEELKSINCILHIHIPNVNMMICYIYIYTGSSTQCSDFFKEENTFFNWSFY